MISSQDGTDARRDRPPAAFLRAGFGSGAAVSSSWRRSSSGSLAAGTADGAAAAGWAGRGGRG